MRLADGARLSGTVLGADPGRDIAVVRVDRSGLPAASLGRAAPVRVGQLAVAIGSPFGLEETVTAGVVSAVGRVLSTDGGIVEVIQTDAPINPGNSGGALADRGGRVIGINIASRGRGSGVSFAVPIDPALEAAERIVRGESPAPAAFLGVTTTDSASGAAGALITAVEPGSPADRARLRIGDLLVAVERRSVRGPADLAAAIRARRPGDRVTVTLVRDGRRTEVVVGLGRRG